MAIAVTWISEICSEVDGTFGKVYCTLTVPVNTVPKDIDNADKYIFEIRRYKDVATREEHLNVKVFEAKWNGTAVVATSNAICAEIAKANIVELENKLINLRVYGVLLGRKYFPKIRQVIEKAYPDLTPRPVNGSTVVTDAIINSIYEMFVRYITEVGIQPGTNGLYNIRVDEFKEYLADTEYSKYKYTDIRAGLANFAKEINGKTVKGTKCSFGRTDNTIAAEKDKRIKVISFVPEVVASYQITTLPEGSAES